MPRNNSKKTIIKVASASSPLAQEFTKILRGYKKTCQRIKRLLDETHQSYSEIQEKRILAPEKITEIRLSQPNQEYIDSLTSEPVALIICSQTYNGKAKFTNDLLGECLLPCAPTVKSDDIVRMIRIKNHSTTGATLNVSGSFELVGDNVEQGLSSWSTVPYEDIIASNSHSRENLTDTDETASLEIRKPLDFLENDLQIVLTPTNQKLDLKQVYAQITDNVIPIFLYIIDQEKLSQEDFEELKLFRAIVPNEPILFIRMEAGDSTIDAAANIDETPGVRIFNQLCDLGFLSLLTTESSENAAETIVSPSQSDMIDNGLVNSQGFLKYIRKHIDRLTVHAVSLLQESHERCLEHFNESVFDMARDILITPKRINYARDKERDLYEALLALTNSKQSEIQRIILQAVQEMEEGLTDQACSLEITGVELTDHLTVNTAKDLKKCTSTVQDFVIVELNKAIAEKLSSSVSILRQDYIGTLKRCLEHLERRIDEDETSASASKALQEILQSTYQVNISLTSNTNYFKILIDKMKELVRTIRWSNSPRIDPDFKKSVAVDMLHNLSEVKLARCVCAQLNDRIRMSHENFETFLKQLESQHTDRLRTTEDRQKRLRKDLTPKIARHLLESTSLKDLIRYGLPKQGREVGRGQYGIVYECDSWANQRSCVLKSVVPPDDRHWNDLALEFHYLRRIPEHPRVVKLIGSVIDYTNRDQRPVLLIMERLARDLHTALKNKLIFHIRIRIALDVIEGLRYLHGLGLVHRDIKLKNVLLDETDHARITDLGFCKPEVMMSGSLVGTPIHMAPELFSTKYDHTVDIYAFGILFWYICSNAVKLPNNFDVCSSKDVLWSRVRHGVRPERLADFSDDCWEIMTKCWDPLPHQRPYLGEVQDKLEQMFSKTIVNS